MTPGVQGMMGVAETCLAFAHLEAPSAALLLRCAASLRRATKTVTDSLQFAKRYQGGAREPVAMALLARMAEVPAPPLPLPTVLRALGPRGLRGRGRVYRDYH